MKLESKIPRYNHRRHKYKYINQKTLRIRRITNEVPFLELEISHSQFVSRYLFWKKLFFYDFLLKISALVFVI